MSQSVLKKAFEINDLFKLAYLAGAAQGIALFRENGPLQALAAVDHAGTLAFRELFTNVVVDPGDRTKLIVIFDQLWKQLEKQESTSDDVR